jgi:hypothetical protein
MVTAIGEDASRVLTSPDFDVIPFADYYQGLSERLGLDFGAILFTLRHVPLGLRGADHAAQRGDAAKLISERRSAVSSVLPGVVARNYGCLGTPGTYDLITKAIAPSVDEMITELIGLAPELDENSLISRVFSQKLGVAKRVRMNAELAILIQRLRSAFPDDSETRLASRLTLVVLGRDAIIGSLALSLKGHIEDAASRFAVPPSHSSVPLVPRIALQPTEIAGQAVAGDEMMLCQLQSVSDDGQIDRSRFFGAGAHMCIGRVLVIDMFKHLSRFMSGLSTKLTVQETTLRDCDVFAVPEHLRIRVEQ